MAVDHLASRPKNSDPVKKWGPVSPFALMVVGLFLLGLIVLYFAWGSRFA